jgi:23S rRNA pseudouridine2605 synthase
VHLDKAVAEDDIKQLNNGVKLDDGSSVVKVIKADGAVLRVELREGRNRQIRRSFEALGYRVTQLHRYKLDKYVLDLLRPGDWKYLEI